MPVMPIFATQHGPRFLRVARTLTLVSGLAMTSCGGSVDASPEDGGDRSDAREPYDGYPTGTSVPDGWVYEGGPVGVAPYDGGPTGTAADIGYDTAYDTFSMGTSAFDAGHDAADAASAEAASSDGGLPGGPLYPPELPSEIDRA